MDKDKIRIFVEDLEETELRLHTYLRDLEEKFDQFKKRPIFKKKKEFDESFRKYTYYQGKFYAYYFVLEKLGSDIPKVLQRLRGIVMNSRYVFEMKAHYTEIYGHFPTEKALKLKKVIK